MIVLITTDSGHGWQVVGLKTFQLTAHKLVTIYRVGQKVNSKFETSVNIQFNETSQSYAIMKPSSYEHRNCIINAIKY